MDIRLPSPDFLYRLLLFVWFLLHSSFLWFSFSLFSIVPKNSINRGEDLLIDWFTFCAAMNSKCLGKPSSADESDPPSSLEFPNYYDLSISFCTHRWPWIFFGWILIQINIFQWTGILSKWKKFHLNQFTTIIFQFIHDSITLEYRFRRNELTDHQTRTLVWSGSQ